MTLLFKPAEVTSAYLKASLTGFAGSGKTKTAAIMAIGLIKLMRELRLEAADKPVYFLDTETGSDWVKPDFDAAGIKLNVAKTRAFSDLVPAVQEARDHGSILIGDSATHFWKELCETYQRTKAKEYKKSVYRLQFQDWGFLKAEWAKFTDIYVNSPLHIILCGRASYEYDYFEDDDGKKQLEKTDVKMNAEKDTGYEPSLALLMERHTDMETMKAYRTATVLKDRGTSIDGQVFRDPTFENFMPHVKLLNLGGRHFGVDSSRTSESLMPAADIRDNTARQRRIVLDEITTLMTLHFPGQTAKEKTGKLTMMIKHFKACWTEMEELMPLFDLRAGYEALHQELEGKPSKYGVRADEPVATPAPATLAEALNDDIPTFLDKRNLNGAHAAVTISADEWMPGQAA